MQYKQWQKTCDVWHVFGKSNALMDDILQSSQTAHYYRKGLVTEDDVHGISSIITPWFQRCLQSQDTIQSFHKDRVLGPHLQRFYSIGEQFRSVYVQKYIAGDKWRTCSKRQMQQSVLNQDARCSDSLKWRQEEYEAFFAKLDVIKSTRTVAHAQDRFRKVISLLGEIDDSVRGKAIPEVPASKGDDEEPAMDVSLQYDEESMTPIEEGATAEQEDEEPVKKARKLSCKQCGEPLAGHICKKKLTEFWKSKKLRTDFLEEYPFVEPLLHKGDPEQDDDNTQPQLLHLELPPLLIEDQ